jgi:hypothetical protein
MWQWNPLVQLIHASKKILKEQEKGKFLFLKVFLTLLGEGAVLVFELRDLVGRCSTAQVMPTTLFCFSYFLGRMSCFCPGLESDHHQSSSLPHSWHSWNHRCAHHTELIGWVGVPLTFCLGWSETPILLSLPLSRWEYRHETPHLAHPTALRLWRQLLPKPVRTRELSQRKRALPGPQVLGSWCNKK